MCFRRGSTSRLLLTILLAGGALLAYVWFQTNPARIAQQLYDQGQFREAGIAARQALGDRGESEALQRLALLADSQWLVPLWQESLLAGDFADAFNLLASAQTLLPEQEPTDTTPLIGLLNRITSLYQLMRDLGADTPEGLVRHRQRMHLVSAGWVSLAPRQQQVAAQLTDQRADFRLLWQAAQAKFTQLESLLSMPADDIESLLEDIDQGLTRDAPAQVDIYIRHFSSAHPNPDVTEDLRQDLALYRSMLQAHYQARLPTLVQQRHSTQFRTSLFEQHARRRFDTRFPPPAVVAEYIEAEQAWRAGELDRAFNITRQLRTKPRGEIAERHLLRFEAISRGYDDLLTRQGDEDFSQHLKRYQSVLDPSRDQFFIQRLHQLRTAPIPPPQSGQSADN